MLNEEEIEQRIKWYHEHIIKYRKEIIDCINDDEFYRIEGLIEKINQSQGKIFAFRLVLNREKDV